MTSLAPAFLLLWALASTDEPKEAGFDALGVPLVSYNSDVGTGVGAVGGAYFYARGYQPYRHGIAAQAFFTTNGVQNHWLRYDGPSLIGSARLEVRLEWRRELYSPFFGPGNTALAGVDLEPSANERRIAYDRLSPGGWVRVRASPFGPDHPLETFVGYGYRWYGIRPYEGSLLESQRPLGSSGGPNGQLLAGLVWDTRDSEADAREGFVHEVSLRGSGAPTASRYSYAGVNYTFRHFHSLATRKLVFGQRLTVDALVGDVPFFEWGALGGLQAVEGIGGMSSVRGVPRNRYVGNTKMVVNSELRWYPFELSLFDAPLELGALLFADLGRAWHPYVPDGPWWAWHLGFGGGLRAARRAAVLRLDVAWAPELARRGVYVGFGHAF